MANRIHLGVRRFVVARSSLSVTLMLAALSWGCRDAQSPTAISLAQQGMWRRSSLSGVPAENIPGQYIVTFKDDVDNVPDVAKNLVEQHGGRLNFTYSAAIRGFAASLSEAAAAALQNNPMVASIELDQLAHEADVQASPASAYRCRCGSS